VFEESSAFSKFSGRYLRVCGSAPVGRISSPLTGISSACGESGFSTFISVERVTEDMMPDRIRNLREDARFDFEVT
jgi:hypothetical protein